MNRPRLCNKFSHNKINTSRKKYKIQQTFYSKPMRKVQKDHFTKLRISSVTSKKNFWQTVKTLSSNKLKPHRILNIIKKDKLNDDDEEMLKRLMNVLLIFSKN